MAGLLYCVRCDTPLMQHEPLHICPACGAVFLRRKKAFAFVADLNGGTAAKELSKEMICLLYTSDAADDV